VWPLEKFISHKPQGEEWMAIWGSVLLGLVAAWGVWQEGVHRRRHLAYQAALKALSDITAAIAAAPNASRQILGQVTQVAADLLEMPIGVFSLWEESNERFQVIYSQGLPMNNIRGHYSFDELPATREAFRRGEPVCAADIRCNPECFDQESAEKHGIRSSIIVPLQLEDRPVGVLALSDKRPRKFSKSDLHLAKLWGQQAAVTVVNSELHRQTQRDAQAKVVLLRELNHRVKNNLASIAGLLCTSPVELPVEVRQWLDRVIERVSGMSRLHELLTDGTQNISVPDLVRKAVDSAILLWPPGVRLSLDLHGGQASLTTDRAVTLAMVMHELMYNALRHGVSNNGMIWITSRVEENHVIIDVIDDASKAHGDHEKILASENVRTVVMDRPLVQVAGKTGLGLQLVRGLVGRELQGQFTFSTLADGRTLARVVFHAIRQL
jgi:two-component sensor histidine kinase